jgi:hypothetical protein
VKTTTYTFDGTLNKTVSDRPEPTKADMTRAVLTLVCTGYDSMIRTRARNNPRVYHNPVALSLYLDAVGRTVADISTGQCLRMALSQNFTGHMLSYLLRKAKVRQGGTTAPRHGHVTWLPVTLGVRAIGMVPEKSPMGLKQWETIRPFFDSGVPHVGVYLT